MRRMRSFFFDQVHLVLGYFLVAVLDLPVASPALVAQNRGSNQAKASAAEEYSEEEETPNLETPKLGPDPQIDPKNEEKKNRDEKTAEKKAIAHQLIDDESQRAFPEWKIGK